IPFAPPIDGGLRVYAATMPLLALLVAVAVGDLLTKGWHWAGLTRCVPLRTVPEAAGPSRVDWPGATLACGLGLGAVAVLGRLGIYFYSHTPRFTEAPCPAGQETVYVRLSPGAVLHVVDDPPAEAAQRVRVPEIRVADLWKTAGTVEIKQDIY